MKPSEIVELLKDDILASSIKQDKEVRYAFLDSRLVEEGSIFFATKGENADGNDFISKAEEKGASLIIADNEARYKKAKSDKILVKNSLDFLKKLGRKRLEKTRATKIMLTGSFGKTGTKELLKSVLSNYGLTYATKGNNNNELGLLLTACGIDDEARFIVLEIGSNAMGEIAYLSSLIKGDIAIVTNAGHAHVGRFKGIENIIEEKLSIARNLKDGGALIIPNSLKDKVSKGDFRIFTFADNLDDKSADIYLKNIAFKSNYISYKCNLGEEEFKLFNPYIHIALNSQIAILICSILNLSLNGVANGISNFSVVEGHGSIHSLRNGKLCLIDDSYNAGMESTIKAIKSLSSMNDFSNKYAILGGIGEIDGYDDKVYGAIIDTIKKAKDIKFFLLRNIYEKYASGLKNVIFLDNLSKMIEAASEIKEGVVLVKASHSYNFSEITKKIKLL